MKNGDMPFSGKEIAVIGASRRLSTLTWKVPSSIFLATAKTEKSRPRPRAKGAGVQD
jgi:hypothetical protein